jgi:hypothetical protein
MIYSTSACRFSLGLRHVHEAVLASNTMRVVGMCRYRSCAGVDEFSYRDFCTGTNASGALVGICHRGRSIAVVHCDHGRNHRNIISKHNVISELSQKTGVPRLPTSMILLGNLILLPLVIGQTVFRLGLLHPPLVLPFTFGSVLGTLIASLAFERALARAAHAAAQWRK